MPPKVASGQCIHSYPVIERNKIIWAWYHPDKVAPMFEVEETPEANSDDWTEFQCFDWEIHSVIQETGENAVDTAHFIYVHSVGRLPTGDINMEGPKRVTELKMHSAAIDENGIVDTTGTKYTEGRLVTKNNGPGQTTQLFDISFKTVMLGSVTPIDNENLHLRFALYPTEGSIRATAGARPRGCGQHCVSGRAGHSHLGAQEVPGKTHPLRWRWPHLPIPQMVPAVLRLNTPRHDTKE